MRSSPLCLLIVFLLVLSGRAGDLASGPEKKTKIPELKVYDATGVHKEEVVDYAADRKDRLTVFLFVSAAKFDRPMNRFMKTLDRVVKDKFEHAYVVAVWLTEDVHKTKEFLPRVQQSVQYEVTALTVFADKDTAGPKGWNVNSDAHLTAVIANKGKVVDTFGYRSLNETDVPRVSAAMDTALKPRKKQTPPSVKR